LAVLEKSEAGIPLHHNGIFFFQLHLGGTTDATAFVPFWDERCFLLISRSLKGTGPIKQGDIMNDQPHEFVETQLQARDCEAPADASLPAGQALAEQSQDSDPANTAPRFIP
jgi:hypothetical protein